MTRVFLQKLASPFLWTRDDLRHLRARKCPNRHPGRAGWSCMNRFRSNASATHHPRRGVRGVWPPAAGMCPARWQAGHRKLPKIQRGTYREIIVFWRPSSKVATKCSFVLPGAGPWHQPVRTLGVTAATHCTAQTTLMLRILLNTNRGTIRRRAPHKAQRPSDRSLRDLRWAWPVAVLEWTTSPLQYGGICLRRHQHSCSNSDIVSVRPTGGNVPNGLHED